MTRNAFIGPEHLFIAGAHDGFCCSDEMRPIHSEIASIDFAPAHPNTPSVRRIAGFLLLITVFFAGSGLAGYLHQLEHLSGPASASITRILGVAEAGHDESTCTICLNLHAPSLAASAVTSLIAAGIFVAFLTQLAPHLTSQRALARIDCRGPPTRSAD